MLEVGSSNRVPSKTSIECMCLLKCINCFSIKRKSYDSSRSSLIHVAKTLFALAVDSVLARQQMWCGCVFNKEQHGGVNMPYALVTAVR